MQKNKLLFGLLISMGLLTAVPALAHVTVKPDQALAGKFITFNVSVPSEKNSATVKLALKLPDGLNYVTPTVKPGWKIETIKSGDGKVMEIIWNGGKVPGELRDDFSFSAQVPTQTTTLAWKAYQTYEDGSMVSWDLSPTQEQPKDKNGKPDFSAYGPYSQTTVADDAKTITPPTPAFTLSWPLTLSILSVVISFLALIKSAKRTT